MADESEVETHESENPELFPSNDNDVCAFCKKQFSKYTCPRCNLRYCSITCYRSEKHLQCSEGFYKQNVIETLKHETGGQEDSAKVMEMLKRLEDGDEEEEIDELNDIEERLRGINLDKDPNAAWEILSSEEKQGFHAAVASGVFADSITLWTPWWRQGDVTSNTAIEELSSNENISENSTSSVDEALKDQVAQEEKQTKKTAIPLILDKIQPLSSILKTANPNPAIKYNVVDVLYAYVYTMHLYNGSPQDDAEHAAETLWSLSSVLSKNMTFETTESVVYNCLNTVLEQKDLYSDKGFSTAVLLDVVQIINGYEIQKGKRVYFVDCALSDTHKLIVQGIRSLKKDKKGDKGLEKKLWLAKKKLEFFLSWTQQFIRVLRSVAPHVKALHHQEMADCETHEAEKITLEKKWKGPRPPPKKKLIEEL